MPAQKAAPPTVAAVLGARGSVSKTDRTSSIAKPSALQPLPVRAVLIGSDCCAAAGLAAHSSAPVLALCRIMIGAGHDPATPLVVWRGNTLALTIRSIGEGAKVEASPRGVGFVHRPDVRGNSHVAQNHRLPLSPDVDAPL